MAFDPQEAKTGGKTASGFLLRFRRMPRRVRRLPLVCSSADVLFRFTSFRPFLQSRATRRDLSRRQTLRL
jgi:hypothetical protein